MGAALLSRPIEERRERPLTVPLGICIGARDWLCAQDELSIIWVPKCDGFGTLHAQDWYVHCPGYRSRASNDLAVTEYEPFAESGRWSRGILQMAGQVPRVTWPASVAALRNGESYGDHVS